jgi:acetyl/propionyl-CoA carboxylase alpha subunit
MGTPGRTLRRLLVANRGEIARRIMRTCRAMGIATVAVFSDPDADAPFVHDADTAVALGGAAPSESYLRADALIDAARRAGADAVHPGYGFLAESADFAAACVEAGLTWVGPAPETIAAMGSKIEAKRRMRDAGVPVLADAAPDDDVAGTVGFPLLVKASAGGGGRGMRIVRDATELPGALDSARHEAEAAFGDGTLFCERYLDAPRHVEIQILGDAHGRVVSLFERECSIQRRHQKILEESPSVAVDEALRERMGEAAVRAGEAIGYVSAGTVEFLLAADGRFYFLEVNTRLQVEHPVTEALTGLDLVRCQLEVAQGEPLGPGASEPRREGHAIEVRLCAEDPARDFLPVTGALSRFRMPSTVRCDSGVEGGSVVSVHYDSLLAKVIAHAPTRIEAARTLARALRAAEIHGLRTNRELLVRALEHDEFLAGATDTGFLERHDPAQLGAPLLDASQEARHAAAAALAAQAARRDEAPVLGALPSGWRNNPSIDQQVSFTGAREEEIAIAYRFDRDGALVSLCAGGEELAGARLYACSADRVDLEADGVRRTYRVRRTGKRHQVNSALGQADLCELERFPVAGRDAPAGSLVSPMPGAVTRVAARAGEHVEAGAVLVVIEAMKMEQEMLAPAAGTVSEVRVAPGVQVETGAVLAVVEAD